MSDLLPCAILIPSLNRPKRLGPTLRSIEATTPEEHRVLFMVSDDESKRILSDRGEWFLDDSDQEDRRYVTRMNELIGHIGDAKTVFFGSDDVLHRAGWLSEALEVMAGGKAVVVVNDGHNPNGTQALVRADYLPRATYDDPATAFHSGYLHNFADNEQHFTAYMQNEYARALRSRVEHLHPIWRASNSIGWDETYANAQKGWDHDKTLFEQRAKLIEAALSEREIHA